MGSRGPQGKPTNLRVLHGDREDRINRNEPQPDTTAVEPPEWLGDRACEVWAKYAPDLIAKKVLTAWDVEAFANFCDAVVRRAVAAKHVEDEGGVVELPVYNKNGDLTGHRLGRNPWSYELKDADAQAQRWGARFGMTPTERANITVHEEKSGGSEDLLSG